MTAVTTHAVRPVRWHHSQGQQWTCDRCSRFWSGTDRDVIEREWCIPDLEFLPPDCPLCGEGTSYEDGSVFYCEPCEVQWPKDGTNGEYIGEPEPVDEDEDEDDE